jgi:hypothetical protein
MTYAPQFMVSIVSGGEYQEPKPTENPFAATLLAEFPWLEQEPSDTGEEDCQVSGADGSVLICPQEPRRTGLHKVLDACGLPVGAFQACLSSDSLTLSESICGRL